MSQAVPKLMLIDANALIHRAYHALPELTSPKGEQVGAVYGFASALLKAIKDEKPDYIAVCYDVSEKTFRNEIYDQYKAHRRETDQALHLQMPKTKQLIEALAMPIYAQRGVEADDLIGSLSKIAVKKGLQSVIVTGDNDALQLVNDSTRVYKLRQGVADTLAYDRDEVKEKIGVYPEQIVDYKALAGDNSDNIPGVPGIGPKTAVELLTKYQDIEGIYQHLDELSERHRRLLSENEELMKVSRRLGQIKTDLEIELDLDKAETSRFDFSKAIGFFQEQGFKSLISRLPQSSIPTSQASLFTAKSKEPVEFKPQLPFQVIDSLVKWQKVLPTIQKQLQLVIDTETDDLEGPLIGLAIAWSGDDSVYLPINPFPGGLKVAELKPDLDAILGDGKIKKIGHNLKYDLKVLHRAGLEVEGAWFDTMIASGLINPQLFSHSLDDIALSELKFQKIPLSALIGPRKKEPITEVPLEKIAAYSSEDVLITWRLFEKSRPDLEAPHLKKVFYEIEMPLLSVVEKMELRGIKIDLQHLEKLSQQLTKRLAAIQKEVWQLVGQEFNLSSPTQLKVILYDQLKLSTKGVKKTKTGLSTDAESLAKLKGEHPVVDLILEHRELAKLINTYIDTLPQLADQQDRIHTTYQQLGSATGRLASNNPNLQNIPIRTKLGQEVRKAFVAGPGQVLLGADYSQAELRVLAHITGDKRLIEAFHSGDDFHQSVGAELGVDRRTAKAINFGIVYGLGSVALAQDLGITTQQAREFIDRYFATFPGVVRYIEEIKQQARDQGYVETIFGRRRYLPDIHSPNPMLRSHAERMAVNHPAQGTVADLMKLAMIQLDEALPEAGKMLLQIHDELLLEVEPKAVKEVAKVIKAVMGRVAELKVPLVVDVKSGPNWGELETTKV